MLRVGVDGFLQQALADRDIALLDRGQCHRVQQFGPFGLVDDLFVAGYVYRILRRELKPGAVAHAWQGEGDVDQVMDVVYSEGKSELGKRAREVLRLAGLG